MVSESALPSVLTKAADLSDKTSALETKLPATKTSDTH